MVMLRDAVRDIEPPAGSAREDAIGAAMALFETRLRRAPRPTRPTLFTTMRWRPTYARALSIAAALVAVGALGLVVANQLGNGDDFDSAGSESIVTDDRSSAANGRLQEVDEGDAENANPAADMSAAELAPSGASNGAEATVAAAETVTESQAPLSDDVRSDPALRPDIDFDQPVTNENELGSFGTHLLELEELGELGSTPNTRCTQPRILGETQYVFDGVATPVLVAVDTELRSVIAIDPATCTVLVEGPLF